MFISTNRSVSKKKYTHPPRLSFMRTAYVPNLFLLRANCIIFYIQSALNLIVQLNRTPSRFRVLFSFKSNKCSHAKHSKERETSVRNLVPPAFLEENNIVPHYFLHAYSFHHFYPYFSVCFHPPGKWMDGKLNFHFLNRRNFSKFLQIT